MKYLVAVVFAVGVLLCGACNRNNDVPAETTLSIIDTYVPVTVQFKKGDTEFVGKIRDMVDNEFVVNSLSELPDDPLGFSAAYNNINFKEYTLLVSYHVHPWKIDTYRSRYYHDNIENTNVWTIHIGTSTRPDEYIEDQYYFTRFAILVKKIPASFGIKFWYSIGSLNTDWGN